MKLLVRTISMKVRARSMSIIRFYMNKNDNKPRSNSLEMYKITRHNTCINYACLKNLCSTPIVNLKPCQGRHMIAQLINLHPALFRDRKPPCSELPEGWYALADAFCNAIEMTLSSD